MNTLPHLRTHNKDGIAAPHKPILLLAILKAYEKGILTTNKVPLSPELIALFKQIWGYLVATNHHPNISYPFYHLTGDKFWTLVTKPGMDDPSQLATKVKSLARLDAAIEYAVIDKDLALQMRNPIHRAQMVNAILTQYFPQTRSRYDAAVPVPDLLAGMDDLLRNTPPKQYQRETKQLLKAKNEEEIFLRGAAFRRFVPMHYNYTCAVTRWQIFTPNDDQLIDACHIVPFSESHDDTYTNGIALSPTIHRAFDRGLIAISDDYKVIVKREIMENACEYALTKLNGQPILLPENPKCHPSIDNLRAHRLCWDF